MLELQDVLRGYVVGERIGKGAKSRIYEVTRRKDGRRFAVKFVLVRSKADLNVVRHLENECRVLRTLHKKGGGLDAVVRPVEFQQVRQFFRLRGAYLILERVWGRSLAEFSQYSLPQGVEIFHQVSEALDSIHARGFVYADLKPHHILLDGNLRVKLIDFGFSAPIGSRLNGLKGTWGYLAPEQAGGELDSQTDVFNLGAVMYWFFTGQNIPSIVPSGRGGGRRLYSRQTPQADPTEQTQCRVARRTFGPDPAFLQERPGKEADHVLDVQRPPRHGPEGRVEHVGPCLVSRTISFPGRQSILVRTPHVIPSCRAAGVE